MSGWHAAQGWLSYTQGAQGLRLPHLFQKNVSPATSAFRYAVRSVVRGALSLFLLSLLPPQICPSSAGTPHPPSLPVSPALSPSLDPDPAPWAGVGGAFEQPPQAGSSQALGGDGCVVPGEGRKHRII